LRKVKRGNGFSSKNSKINKDLCYNNVKAMRDSQRGWALCHR
jgi:hypothetical protein